MPRPESEIADILNHPLDYDGWVAAGLGLLRLPLNDERTERLHIWDTEQALNDVASAHDHPWDLDATIYFGKMGNQRYRTSDEGGVPAQGSSVVCGVGGYLTGENFQTRLHEAADLEVYEPGETYHMEAEEFHNSFPDRGTVTVITKGLRPERNIATILWASQEPWKQEGFTREASAEEIMHFVGLVALQ